MNFQLKYQRELYHLLQQSVVGTSIVWIFVPGVFMGIASRIYIIFPLVFFFTTNCVSEALLYLYHQPHDRSISFL